MEQGTHCIYIFKPCFCTIPKFQKWLLVYIGGCSLWCLSLKWAGGRWQPLCENGFHWNPLKKMDSIISTFLPLQFHSMIASKENNIDKKNTSCLKMHIWSFFLHCWCCKMFAGVFWLTPYALNFTFLTLWYLNWINSKRVPLGGNYLSLPVFPHLWLGGLLLCITAVALRSAAVEQLVWQNMKQI